MRKYLSVILFFCLAKWWHQTADPTSLRWLLSPTDVAVSAATGSTSSWHPALGYYHPSLSMAIDASCSGFNFLLIAFLLLSYLLLRRFERWRVLPLALIAAYPLTIIANSSRILTILLTGAGPSLVSAGVWHEAQGAFIYLFTLVVTSLSLYYYLPRLGGKFSSLA